ncbi:MULTISPECIES: hypothetical protein [unclassified Neisseria]|uniref:hypothetical protein n=1 Tax=unclassified Neisseria TaxID=2623750 RepID=UPI00107173A4|nr:MULTISPECIES: hypothetical protein [unclassified Neisseria]MBF0805053.1 hypothetical protein [Neisseria sp. 19428wB4_WF04]TFU38551.1 hypothetical protein E4T99_12405 [Neisseria sp. WF04]
MLNQETVAAIKALKQQGKSIQGMANQNPASPTPLKTISAPASKPLLPAGFPLPCRIGKSSKRAFRAKGATELAAIGSVAVSGTTPAAKSGRVGQKR